MDLKKFRLLALIDSVDYTLQEVYQEQLYEELIKKLDVSLLSLNEIASSKIDPKQFDGVFCSIRIRNTLKYSKQIQAFLKGTPVIVVDFDPWVNFIDSSPYKGCYNIISQDLHVKHYFVSAKTWADKLVQQGHPAVPVKVGMKPSYIVSPINFSDKKRAIEFRGSSHEPRKIGQEKLKQAGLDVPWLPAVRPYSEFLKSVNDLKIWCHNEGTPVVVDETPINFNALWPKALEVLARGCFVVRDFQDEALWYDMDKLPTASLFKQAHEARTLVDDILNRDPNKNDEMIKETLGFMRQQNYWAAYVTTLVEHFK